MKSMHKILLITFFSLLNCISLNVPLVLRSKWNGLVLQGTTGSSEVTLQKLDPTDIGQKWLLQHNALVNIGNGHYLQIVNGVAKCTGTGDLFEIENSRVYSKGTSNVLDVLGWSTEEGSHVGLWEESNQINQMWDFLIQAEDAFNMVVTEDEDISKEAPPVYLHQDSLSRLEKFHLGLFGTAGLILVVCVVLIVRSSRSSRHRYSPIQKKEHY